jgi:hypothetical protein
MKTTAQLKAAWESATETADRLGREAIKSAQTFGKNSTQSVSMFARARDAAAKMGAAKEAYIAASNGLPNAMDAYYDDPAHR